MFHFPALPPHRLYIHRRVTRHHSRRVSPFGHPRINARLTAPRGISQPPTSFIGSRCQGIHHAPFNTYKHKNQEKLHKQTRHHTNAATHPFLRCSQPLSNTQTPHPTTKTVGQHPNQSPSVASGPNSVPAALLSLETYYCTQPPPTTSRDSSRPPPHNGMIIRGAP